MRETKINQIATKIKQLKRDGYSTILFLGAGASKTAGIPLASEIMHDLDSSEDYKDFISACDKKTYPQYMNCLSSNDRKKLFKSYISKAKINPAHYYAAQLVSQEFVDCVVTTNFDPLMLRSLTQFYGIIPSVYDLAITREIVTADFEYPAIIHLHGQAHGFWQLNTDDELDLPVKVMSDTFSKISVNRAWIVVGYSGNDPVLDHLVKVGNFGENLYWVGYEENEPSDNVKTKLLDKPASGSYILKGYNADTFFLELRNQLKLGEPGIFLKPFTYLLDKINTIMPIVKDDKTLDMFTETKSQIEAAIIGFEEGKGFTNLAAASDDRITRDELLQKVKEILNNYAFDKLNSLEKEIETANDDEINLYYSAVYFYWGNSLYDLGKRNEGEESENLFKGSFIKYQKAVEIKKDDYEAYYNWGIALTELGMRKDGWESESLFKESFIKYQKAVEIRKDFQDTFINWGVALTELGKRKEGEESERLFKESFGKYQKAVEIKEDDHEAYNNWGNALTELAKRKNGVESENLFKECFSKYQKAVEIKKDFYAAYYNWGIALIELGMRKEGKESESMFNESFTKYQKAVEIKKDFHTAYYNWGIALLELRKRKDGVESENLLVESLVKFQKTVEIKKDYYAAYNNWGIGLKELAMTKEGEVAEKIFSESFAKYQKAVEIKKDFHEAYCNWGISLSELGKRKKGVESESLLKESLIKFQKAIEIKNDFNEAYRNLGITLSELGKRKEGEESVRLFVEGIEAFTKAENIRRGTGSYGLACYYSLLDDIEKSLEWFESALKDSKEPRGYIESDTDLDNIRNDRRYKELLDKYRPEK